ncbi:type VI secretion system baseplate subunit TssE [Pseudomonas sp.]|jgi:type VI secretion system protein|uniref:type VI secretion system baseplate subunit TssE n=1 Tax=Pseudomonas sp. TaxID=306 RepID=UPI002729DE36|nr:type VI secretion system baseplate subunit TssE [Pseudomonas sp.]
MGYGSLFERLAGETTLRSDQGHAEAVAASVSRHLTRMLSTRAGSVQTLPDYGLPHLNDMRLSTHDALQQARAAIERFIEKHEPRLRNVRVTAMPRSHDPLCLLFAIEGMLDVAGQRQKISLSASLSGSGQVSVQ